MIKFKEIENAILEDVSISRSTYVGMEQGSSPLIIEGSSLIFDLGCFVIENPYIAVNSENSNIELKDLFGDKVKSAYSTNKEIKLVFESGSSISVSMEDDDFRGPEAASFSPKKGSIIVFN